jgi:hypothetical protein
VKSIKKILVVLTIFISFGPVAVKAEENLLPGKVSLSYEQRAQDLSGDVDKQMAYAVELSANQNNVQTSKVLEELPSKDSVDIAIEEVVAVPESTMMAEAEITDLADVVDAKVMETVVETPAIFRGTADSEANVFTFGDSKHEIEINKRNSHAMDWSSKIQHVKDHSYFELSMNSSKASQSASRFSRGLTADGISIDLERYETKRVGFQFAWGYQYTDWSALEISFMDLGTVDIDFETASADQEKLEASINRHYPAVGSGWTLSNRFRMKPWERVMISGEVGLLFRSSTTNVDILSIESRKNSNRDVYFGVGTGYELNENWALNLRLRRIFSDHQKIDLLGIGLSVRF